MNITFNTNTFSEVVHIVSRFAERKSATLQALSAVLITAEDGRITMRATNLEVSVVLHMEGIITTPGSIAFPSAILKNIATSLAGSGSASIEQKGDTAVIISGSGKSTIKTISSDDFPLISTPENTKQFPIEGSLLKQLIGAVASCASTSTIRPELASVLITAQGGKLTAVATDSFRLIEKQIPLPQTVPVFTTLIPAKNAADILQVIPDSTITLSLDEHQGSFVWDGNILSTRLVSASYPDYTQIIPKTYTAEATVSKKEFEESIKRVSIFSDSFQKVSLGFDVKKKQLLLSAVHTDIGESIEPVSAEVKGDSITLSFNYRYLQTPLPLITTETITLQSGGIGRPLIIRGVGDTGMLYLVMPMNQ